MAGVGHGGQTGQGMQGLGAWDPVESGLRVCSVHWAHLLWNCPSYLGTIRSLGLWRPASLVVLTQRKTTSIARSLARTMKPPLTVQATLWSGKSTWLKWTWRCREVWASPGLGPQRKPPLLQEGPPLGSECWRADTGRFLKSKQGWVCLPGLSCCVWWDLKEFSAFLYTGTGHLVIPETCWRVERVLSVQHYQQEELVELSGLGEQVVGALRHHYIITETISSFKPLSIFLITWKDTPGDWSLTPLLSLRISFHAEKGSRLRVLGSQQEVSVRTWNHCFYF